MRLFDTVFGVRYGRIWFMVGWLRHWDMDKMDEFCERCHLYFVPISLDSVCHEVNVMAADAFAPEVAGAPCDVKYGPLARYVKLRAVHAPGTLETFFPPPRVSDPDMHRSTCVTHVPWCIPRSLNSGFLWCRWRGKCSRRVRNPQFYVSGKSPLEERVWWIVAVHSYLSNSWVRGCPLSSTRYRCRLCLSLRIGMTMP